MDPRFILVALACIGLSGCASVPVGNLCTAGPFILDPGASDRLTRSEKEQVVTLNNSGVKICGWRAPR